MKLEKNGFALKIKKFTKNYGFFPVFVYEARQNIAKLSSQWFALRESSYDF